MVLVVYLKPWPNERNVGLTFFRTNKMYYPLLWDKRIKFNWQSFGTFWLFLSFFLNETSTNNKTIMILSWYTAYKWISILSQIVWHALQTFFASYQIKFYFVRYIHSKIHGCFEYILRCIILFIFRWQMSFANGKCRMVEFDNSTGNYFTALTEPVERQWMLCGKGGSC